MFTPDTFTLACLLVNKRAARREALPHIRLSGRSLAISMAALAAIGLVVTMLEIGAVGKDASMVTASPAARAGTAR